MRRIFTYQDEELYSHHTLDEVPRPEDFPMHVHESLEVYCFLSGQARYMVEGHRYDLKPWDILIMRPGETHKLMVAPSEPYERIAIHFPSRLFEALDPRGLLLRPFFRRPLGHGNFYSSTAYPQLHTAFQEFTFSGSPQLKLHILARLLLFLTALGDIWDKRGLPEDIPGGLAAQLVAYVNDHLFEDISLEQIGDVFSRSRTQIGRLFRETTGSTLWEYVTIKRLLAAQAMLQRGKPASRVCTDCGFRDYSSFFRAYRKRYGYAPSQERRVDGAGEPQA